MKTAKMIPAGEFKAKCLKLMQDIAEKRNPIIITKHGKQLVQVIPLMVNEPQSYYGCMKGTVNIKEDITKPIDVEWNANEE